jgi:hypothetical protein
MVDGLQYLYDTWEGDDLLDKAWACSIIDDDGRWNQQHWYSSMLLYGSGVAGEL